MYLSTPNLIEPKDALDYLNRYADALDSAHRINDSGLQVIQMSDELGRQLSADLREIIVLLQRANVAESQPPKDS